MKKEPRSFSLSNNVKLDISSEEITYKDRWGIHRTSKPLAIRCGTIPMDVYHLRLGYNYKIEIFTEDHQTISIPFKAYLGFGRSKIFDTYNEVIEALYEYHFNNIYDDLIEKYTAGMDLDFGEKCVISGEQLLLTNKKKSIPLDDIRVDDRFDHFIVSSKQNSSLFANIYYLKTWNSGMLFSLLESIAKTNN